MSTAAWHQATKLIHGGFGPDESTGATVAPIVQSTAFAYGSAEELEVPLEMEMRGRDLLSGLPAEVIVNDEEIRRALERSIKLIVENIKAALEVTPPELTADIYERGMVLTGGGALLKGLDKLIARATEVPVRIADDPLTCLVRGTGILLENKKLLKEVQVPSGQTR